LKQHTKFLVGVTTSNEDSITYPAALACHQLWLHAEKPVPNQKLSKKIHAPVFLLSETQALEKLQKRNAAPYKNASNCLIIVQHLP